MNIDTLEKEVVVNNEESDEIKVEEKTTEEITVDKTKEEVRKEKSEVIVEDKIEETITPEIKNVTPEDEIEKIRRQAYLDGVKKSFNGINPYNQQKIEDEYDLQVFETMQELKEKGLDPIKDFPKYVADKNREAIAKQKEEEEKKQAEQVKLQEELKDFIATYPKVDVNELLKNEEFSEVTQGLLEKISIKEAYELYQRVSLLAKKKNLVKQTINETAVGSQNDETSEDETLYTLEQIEKMSSKEYKANHEKIKKSLKKLGIYY